MASHCATRTLPETYRAESDHPRLRACGYCRACRFRVRLPNCVLRPGEPRVEEEEQAVEWDEVFQQLTEGTQDRRAEGSQDGLWDHS